MGSFVRVVTGRDDPEDGDPNLPTRLMKILQVSPKIPYPLTDGGSIGIFNLTKHLSLLGHQVTLACFGGGGEDGRGAVEEYARVEVVPLDRRNSVFGALAALSSPIPYTIGKYQSAEMERRLDQLIASGGHDVVQVEHLHLAHYGVRLKEKFGLPAFLREHNFETAIWERFAESANSPWLRWYGRSQLPKVRAYEAQMAARFNCCFMISARDETRLREVSPAARTSVIPAGVDVETFVPGSPDSEEPGSILFLGSLHWFPNQDALEWFLRTILPKVVRRIPAAKLYVVGKNPPPRILRLSHPNVVVAGFVDDVIPYMRRCSVCVVPLRIGGGMRIKILELLAMKKAIVSTSIGCEGIDLQDGRELLVADGAEAFTDKLCQLLEQPERRRALGEAGRSTVSRHYDWRSAARRMASLYESTLRSRAPA